MKRRHTFQVAEMVSIGEAARQLGMSIDTLRRWEAEGKMHAVRTPGGQRRFAQSEVDRIRTGVPA